MLTTHARFLFLITVFELFLSLNDSFELPFLQTCTIEDEKCHIDKMSKFIEMYRSGIKELDLPALDPLNLDDITIKGNSNLQIRMKRPVLHKYSNLKCLGIKGFTNDHKAMHIVVKVLSPQIIVKTLCTMKGNLLLFVIDGEMDMKIDSKNVITTMKIKLLPYMENGVLYYKASDVKIKLEIGSIAFAFSNSTLFNGKETILKTFEDTINSNTDILLDEIKSYITDAFGRAILEILNKVFPTMPYEKFFKESG